MTQESLLLLGELLLPELELGVAEEGGFVGEDLLAELADAVVRVLRREEAVELGNLRMASP